MSGKLWNTNLYNSLRDKLLKIVLCTMSINKALSLYLTILLFVKQFEVWNKNIVFIK